MFAVPGWNVDANTIKAQEQSSESALADQQSHRRSKKRKRGIEAPWLNPENLSNLWDKHVAHRGGSKDAGGVVSNVLANKRKKEQDKGSRRVDGSQVTGREKQRLKGTLLVEDDAEERSPIKDERAISQKGGLLGRSSAGLSDNLKETRAAPPSKQSAKAKFEERKAKKLKKRELKTQHREDGEIPPARTAKKDDPYPVAPATENRKQQEPTKNLAAAEDIIDLLSNSKLKKKRGRCENVKGPQHPGALEVPPRYQSPPASSYLPPAKLPSRPPASSIGLTPLQQKMRQKLVSARFRHLNQQLYTTHSSHSANLFASSPEIYASYHAGFQAQVVVWPQNPVDLFVREILQRGKVRVQQSQRAKSQHHRQQMKKGKRLLQVQSLQQNGKFSPLPRSTGGKCHIADLGCGTASLSASLQPQLSSLNLSIQSFDLAKSPHPSTSNDDAPANNNDNNAHLVTIADITSLPSSIVPDASIDLVICCLSLMPTNWPKIVDTAARILRAGGEAWVAEVRSRFARKKQKKPRSGGGQADDDNIPVGDGDDGDNVDEDYGAEQSGALAMLGEAEVKKKKKKGNLHTNPPSSSQEDYGQETDLSAFIEVFRRRGMEVREIDQANKMFVGVKFMMMKRRTNNVGMKGEKREDRRGVVVDVGKEEEEETKVLKPCVYKLR